MASWVFYHPLESSRHSPGNHLTGPGVIPSPGWGTMNSLRTVLCLGALNLSVFRVPNLIRTSAPQVARSAIQEGTNPILVLRLAALPAIVCRSRRFYLRKTTTRVARRWRIPTLRFRRATCPAEWTRATSSLPCRERTTYVLPQRFGVPFGSPKQLLQDVHVPCSTRSARGPQPVKRTPLTQNWCDTARTFYSP